MSPPLDFIVIDFFIFISFLVIFFVTHSVCFIPSTGIIDLTNMPPTILVPHPGGTNTPPMDRITYIPGTQLAFPPRPYNPASMSPGWSTICVFNIDCLSFYPFYTFAENCFELWLSPFSGV